METFCLLIIFAILVVMALALLIGTLITKDGIDKAIEMNDTDNLEGVTNNDRAD